MLGKCHLPARRVAYGVALCFLFQGLAGAGPTFTTQVFATGAGVGATAPDSVTYANGSVWVEYGNGVPSDGTGGPSTIVQYSTAGTVQHTYSIAGSVDGLNYDPYTGQIWALQNQDANSSLTIIDPVTHATTHYSYGSSYTGSSIHGFDEAAFLGGKVFLSETNPASTSDPVIVQLTNSSPSSPVQFTSVLTGKGILATDPDSLKVTPNGGLMLTGGGDSALTFITNPGMANQTANSLAVIKPGGALAGGLDDALYATAAAGTFYVTDTGANTVYAITATGLTANSSLFADAGGAFNSLDPTTGIVTAILTGTSPHGMAFVPTPEPSTLASGLAGLGLGLLALYRRRKAV